MTPRSPHHPQCAASSSGGMPFGFKRLNDEGLLNLAAEWLAEDRRNSDTPIMGLSLIQELSERFSKLRTPQPAAGTGEEQIIRQLEQESGGNIKPDRVAQLIRNSPTAAAIYNMMRHEHERRSSREGPRAPSTPAPCSRNERCTRGENHLGACRI